MQYHDQYHRVDVSEERFCCDFTFDFCYSQILVTVVSKIVFPFSRTTSLHLSCIYDVSVFIGFCLSWLMASGQVLMCSDVFSCPLSYMYAIMFLFCW